jgi:uncharacterized protein (DUF39 family)
MEQVGAIFRSNGEIIGYGTRRQADGNCLFMHGQTEYADGEFAYFVTLDKNGVATVENLREPVAAAEGEK